GQIHEGRPVRGRRDHGCEIAAVDPAWAWLRGPAAERSILSRTVFHLPPQAGGREKLLRTARVQLCKPRGRYEIVDFSNKFARFNGVHGFVHHRPPLKRPLWYGFPRD